MLKRPKVAFRYGRKECIFCGGTPVSNEHVWPQWAKPLMPKADGHRRFVLRGRIHQPAQITKKLDRQGSVASIRIPRVCGACNSGWMSAYEGQVRPFISRMMAGERVVLSEESQRLLAEYFTYKFMVMEWMEDGPILPPEAARAFLTDRTIPPNTTIHIMNCFEGVWRSAHRSHSCGLCKPEDYLGPEMTKNTKSSAIGFGNLFVFSIFSTEVQIDLEVDPACVIRLWPLNPTPVHWPPSFPIDSGQAEFIAQTLERLQYDVRMNAVD